MKVGPRTEAQEPTVAETEPTTALLQAALSYAEHGWRVFPVNTIVDGTCGCGDPTCSSPGKHPRIKGWQDAATVDPQQVNTWWAHWPWFNLGIVTGATSGLVVLDVDPRHDGDETLHDLEAAHGELPVTVTATTGGGGEHFYFKHPGFPVSNGVGSLGPGLDIRGDGGFVVAPPSTHASALPYAWDPSGDPDDVGVADLPAWIVDLLRDKTGQGHQGAGERLDPAAILHGVPVGQRNDTMYRYCCRLRGKGVTIDEAETLVRAIVVNTSQDSHPFTIGEALECLRSAWTHPPNDARDLADGLPGPDRAHGFNIVYGDAIESLPPPEWQVEDVLVKGSLAFLYGKPGIGKSIVALDLAATVSTGMDWHGHAVIAGRALYVIAEGLGDFGLRVEAFRVAKELDALPDMGYILKPVNLFDQKGYEADRFIEDVRGWKPSLVIFDTLARCTVGGEENSAKDMGIVVAAADRIRHQLDATVFVVAHTGKDGKLLRGSSALEGAADTAIRASLGTSGDLLLKCAKQKMAAPFSTVAFRLATSGSSVALVPSKFSQSGTKLTEAQLLGARLVPDEGITFANWKMAFMAAGGTEGNFRHVRDFLKKVGAIRQPGQGRGSPYFITDEWKKTIQGAKGAK